MSIVQKLQNLILSNSRGIEIHEECLSLEKKEVLDIISFISDLEADKERISKKIMIHENEMKLIKFDFEVLESLYKNCYGEMVKQEKTINALRQAYLDHHIEKFNFKLDNSVLERTLKERNESLECCNEVFSEFDIIRNELKDFGRNSQLDIQSEVKCISSQLYQLQHFLSNLKDDNNFEQSSKDSEEPNSKRLCEVNKTQHTNTIKYLRSKIKHKNDIIKVHKHKARKLQKKHIISKEKCQILKLDNIFHQENHTKLERELLSSKNQINSLNISLEEWQEKCDILTSQLEPLQNLLKEKDHQLKTKQDAVQWLEFELNESLRKGSEICCESKQIFGGVKKWLYIVKKERRSLILKIRDLQNINRLLTSQQRDTITQDYRPYNISNCYH